LGILDIYDGRETWSDYISGQPGIAVFGGAMRRGTESSDSPEPGLQPGSIKVGLNSDDYQVAVESGLGALGAGLGYTGHETRHVLELRFDKLAAGLEGLGADFNLLMGDLIWMLEMQQETLNNILQEIRLAEFEREARAYRNRAERAYFNGWYEEALADFLEAEKRNYPDFAVHRSIANILLYHLVDLPRALDYFRRVAKYAGPSDARQAAEANYFAAIICLIGRQLDEAGNHFRQAIEYNPDLLDAYYQQATISALESDYVTAIACLEPAIKGDPRYFERARREQIFDGMKRELTDLLERLMQPAREKANQVKRDRERLSKYVILGPEEERLTHLFDEIEQKMAGPKAFLAGLGFLETLSRAQRELSGIYDLFHKQYEIDPRDYVRSIAFSPDGRLLGAGFLNGGIMVWDVARGIDILSVTGHLASVNSVAFSPDNQLLATASRDRIVKLWDVARATTLLNLIGHTDEVRAATFSPDGQWLASGSHDRTVRIWRVQTGREVQSLAGHTNKVTSTLFSPDGRLVATGSSDKTVKLWEPDTGREILTLKGHLKGVASLAFSPDGRWLASGSDDTTVRLWEVATGRIVQTLRGHRYSVTSIAFSPDGKLLAAGSLGQTVMLWRLSTGAAVKSLRYSDISYNSVAFSPQGQWLAFGSRDLQLWLKAVLTSEQYATVKSDDNRLIKPEPDGKTPGGYWATTDDRAGDGAGDKANDGAIDWSQSLYEDKLMSARFIFDRFTDAAPHRDGLCEVCFKKLGRFERIFHERCKLHR
jgi:WD40 repeat protein/tetratricopeptide (TPR) repeat protein